MNIKKIKLIRIPYFSYVRYPRNWSGMKCEHFPPLALGVITGYLRSKGIEIEQDDLQVKVHYDNLHNLDRNKYVDGEIFFDKDRILSYLMGNKDTYLDKVSGIIIKKTKFKGFDLVLLSAPPPLDITPILSTLVIAKNIKEEYKVPIAIGGCGTPDEWLLALRLKIIDFIGTGPGEITLEKLINALRTNEDLSSVPGLNYFNNKKIVSARRDAFSTLVEPDFDGLPLEKYPWENTLLEKVIFQKTGSPKKIFILPFYSLVGCPFRCAFCAYVNQKVLYLHPNQAVERLKKLSVKYRTRYFYFLDTTVNFSQEYVNQLCDGIISHRLNISWSASANFKNLNEKTLYKMRKAGATVLIWGLESGSQRLLNYINKGITLEKTARILKIAHQLGIWNGVNLIVGMPHEREEDIRATIDFVNKNREFIDTVYLNPFYLNERSLFYKFPHRYGLENIRRIDIYTYGKGNGISDVFGISYAFDEVYGLKWDKKVDQINYSLKKTREEVGEDFWTNETGSILFHLYSIFGDNKERIKKIYAKWAEVTKIGRK